MNIIESFKKSEDEIFGKYDGDFNPRMVVAPILELNKQAHILVCDGEMARWKKREETVMNSIKEKPAEKERLQEGLLIAINEVYHWQKQRELIRKSK